MRKSFAPRQDDYGEFHVTNKKQNYKHMKYHLITLGCQMNISDSERVSAVLESMGYIRTENEEEASLLGILACSVRQKPIDKIYNKIAQWNKWKNKRNLITFVSGCILPADREKFLKTFDLIFQMSELAQLPDMIREYGIVTPAGLKQPIPVMPKNEHITEMWHIKPKYQSTYEAFVPIQNGCDKFCTFCAVPYTRGREVSRPSAEILDEVRHLVNQGYKSITLLGQNVNSYGLDKNGEEINFADTSPADWRIWKNNRRGILGLFYFTPSTGHEPRSDRSDCSL